MNKRWFLLVVLLLFISHAANGSVQEKTKRMKVQQLFQQFEQIVGIKLQKLVVTLTFRDEENKPLENVEVNIVYDAHQEHISPHRPGVFSLALEKSLVDKDAVVHMQVKGYAGKVKLGVEFRGTGASNSPEVKFVSVGDAPSLKSRQYDLVVYYPGEEELALAKQIMELIEQVAKKMRSLLQVEPRLPFGVLLTAETTSAVIVGEPDVWPYKYKEESFERLQGWLIHEWTESTINAHINLHADNVNRWISDGLSEWTEFHILSAIGEEETVVGLLSKDIQNGIDPLLTQGRRAYDLREFSWSKFEGLVGGPAERALAKISYGYPISRAYFMRLTERHGDEFISRFLREAASIQKPKNKDLIKLLERLTGEKLEREIKSFSLAEAKEILEKARGRTMNKVVEKVVDESRTQEERARAARRLLDFQNDPKVFDPIKAQVRAKIGPDKDPVEFLKQTAGQSE